MSTLLQRKLFFFNKPNYSVPLPLKKRTQGMEKQFKRTLITTALPYANGPVHIGHLAGVYVPSPEGGRGFDDRRIG